MRVILVRFFPKVLGSTRNASNQHYAKYGSRSGPKGHNVMTSNGLASNTGKEANDRNGITFTKTFEVEHGGKEADEINLVEMDDFSGKGSKVKSGNSSQVSL